MTNQAQKALTPVGELCVGLTRIEAQLEQALPKGVTKEKFMRTALQGIQTHKDKDKLASADRHSFYLAVQKAASDGLLLDGREAALVVFNTKQPNGTYTGEVQLIPMVQGLVKLARNSGEIKNIESQVVFQNDKFTYVMGEDSTPRHEADWFGDRGEPVGAWAVVTLQSGEKIPAILSRSKIMRVAAKSKNGYQYEPTKGDAWEEWWKKTAIKNVLKYAPRSTELDRALESDEEMIENVLPSEPNPVQENVVAIEAPKRKRAVDKVIEAAEQPTVIDAEVKVENSDEFEEVPI